MAKNLLYFDTTEEIKSVLNENEKLTTPPPTVALDKESGKVYYNPYAVKSREQIFFENNFTDFVENEDSITFYKDYTYNTEWGMFTDYILYIYIKDFKKLYALNCSKSNSYHYGYLTDEYYTTKTNKDFEKNLIERDKWKLVSDEELLKFKSLFTKRLSDGENELEDPFYITLRNLFNVMINLEEDKYNDAETDNYDENGVNYIVFKLKQGGSLSNKNKVLTYNMTIKRINGTSKYFTISNYRLEDKIKDGSKYNKEVYPYCDVYIYDPKD